MPEEKSPHQKILVVGGGMSGLTAAVEAAEAGYEVVIVERNPYLGGRVAQLNLYFPKNCPPACGLEINFRRVRENPRIRFFVGATVEKVEGEAGAFTATIKRAPKYVRDAYADLSQAAEGIAAEIDNPFDFGMDKVKAVYRPYLQAMPGGFIIDPSVIGTPDADKLKAELGDLVDLDAAEETLDLEVGAVVWATGWNPYDASKIEYYGFGKYPNVINNVMMERLASFDGPTGGKILRPSDGAEPKSVAFIQCAGSRDLNHLAYCSGVCCLASIKQAGYVRDKLPEADVSICFIDIRAQDRLDEVYQKAQVDEKIKFVKSKIANITEGDNGNLILEGEDTRSGEQLRTEAELVVLATGMQPNTAGLPEGVAVDEHGFIQAESGREGIVGAGCARKPYNVAESVQDATRAALKAIQAIAARR